MALKFYSQNTESLHPVRKMHHSLSQKFDIVFFEANFNHCYSHRRKLLRKTDIEQLQLDRSPLLSDHNNIL